MINNTKIIAVCTSRINDSSTCELISELNQRLVADNCRLFVYHLCSDQYWQETYMRTDTAVFDLIDYSIIDAVILMDEKIKDKELGERIVKQARSNKVPVITVDCNPDYEGAINVRFDFVKGFEGIVRHIVEDHGVRDVHFMAGYKGNSFSEERLDVFKKVIAENGIRFKESMVSYGDFWAEPTKQAMQQLLARGTVPEAIICANDIMAINVCDVLKDYGYQVPQQVKVTGFDGIDEIYFLKPHITSSVCNYRHMAIKLYEILSDCFIGRPITKENYIVPKMLLASSCGCNKNHQKKDSNYIGIMNSRFHRYQDDSKVLAYIAENMHVCHNLDELSHQLLASQISEVTCVINKSCNDDSMNPTDMVEYAAYDNKVIVLHDAGGVYKEPTEIKLKDIYKNIDNLLDKKVPLIFNALFAWNKVLGYACFAFEDIDVTTFGKIPLIISAFNQGIGGYMNTQYQRYLRRTMEEMYKYDSLTGIYNRMGFNVELAKKEAQLKSKNPLVTVIMSDLDGLKHINDNYGHMAGDKAIVVTANALKESCPADALCMRLGGDEMLAVVIGKCDTEKIKKSIEKYLKKYNETSGLPYEIDNSVGFYQTKEMKSFDLDSMIMAADKAMYEEKALHHKNDEE